MDLLCRPGWFPSVGVEIGRLGLWRSVSNRPGAGPADNLPRRTRNAPRLTNNTRWYRPIGVHTEVGPRDRLPPVAGRACDLAVARPYVRPSSFVPCHDTV